MIALDEIKRTTKNTELEGFSLCFHCGKQIIRRNYSIRICLCKNHILTSIDGIFQYIDFHIDCWEEIAGEEYMFDAKEKQLK